jgi:hypothetical protein
VVARSKVAKWGAFPLGFVMGIALQRLVGGFWGIVLVIPAAFFVGYCLYRWSR